MRSWRDGDAAGGPRFLPEADGDGAVRRGAGRRELRGRAAAVRVPGPGGVDWTGVCPGAAADGAADPDRLQFGAVVGGDARGGSGRARARLRRGAGRGAPGPAELSAHVARLAADGGGGAAVADPDLPGPEPDRPGGRTGRPARAGCGRRAVRDRRRPGLRRAAGRDPGLRPGRDAAGRAGRVGRGARGRGGDAHRAAAAAARVPWPASWRTRRGPA